MALTVRPTSVVAAAIDALPCCMPPSSSHQGVAAVSYRVEATRAGISFGSALAIAISWSANHSILWAIIQGLCSWLYVVYYVLKR